MKILHITNWYPSKHSKKKAPFIKRQIDALDLYAANVIWHLEIIKDGFSIKKGTNEDGSKYLIVSLPFEIWRINEWLSFWMVLWVLLNEDMKSYDVLNFHIAYPNCTYVHLIKKFLKIPVVITEHWSAYHFNFNVSNKDKLIRIKRIFQKNIPVIVVSNALANDIKQFSEADFQSYVVPNVVDTEVFYYKSLVQQSTNDLLTFFMVSQWKWPKDPFTVIGAWSEIIKKFPNAILKIGGYGPQWDEMNKLVQILKLDQNIYFLDYLNSEEISVEMNKAMAFIHCSEYETFSVVCAEAICCGIPVITRKIGGINDFINDNNGKFFSTKAELIDSVETIIRNKKLLNGHLISNEAKRKFSYRAIGEKYYNILKNNICEIK